MHSDHVLSPILILVFFPVIPDTEILFLSSFYHPSSNLHLSPSYLTSISPVFTDEWFGAVDENNHIMNSRYGTVFSSYAPIDHFQTYFMEHFMLSSSSPGH